MTGQASMWKLGEVRSNAKGGKLEQGFYFLL